MTRFCEKRDTCKFLLDSFLQKNIHFIQQQKINEKVLEKRRVELAKIRQKNAFKNECSQCFDEAEKLFEKQVQLFKSLNIYCTDKEDKQNITISEEQIVTSILEPVANVKRLQILKNLAIREHTFSDFIQITGLQGGNLLFHLQKLSDSGLIIQRHGRGDYMITDKGYRILKALCNLHLELKDHTPFSSNEVTVSNKTVT